MKVLAWAAVVGKVNDSILLRGTDVNTSETNLTELAEGDTSGKTTDGCASLL